MKNIITILTLAILFLSSCTKNNVTLIDPVGPIIPNDTVKVILPIDTLNQDISDIDTSRSIYGTWTFTKQITDDGINLVTQIKGYKVRFVHKYLLSDKNNDGKFDYINNLVDNGTYYGIDRTDEGLGEVVCYPYFNVNYNTLRLERNIGTIKETWYFIR